MKKVNKVCYEYDWKYIETHEELLIHILEQKYYIKCKWSAYNFLYLNGPNPIFIFFSFNILTLDNIYSKYNMNKLREYATI